MTGEAEPYGEPHKVPRAYQFVDFSDYARPLADWAVHRLVHTPVSPHLITLFYGILGLWAAILYARGTWPAGALAGLLLILKSLLDAMDGALARARNRPTKAGRFLDSNLDFLINAAVVAGIAQGYPISWICAVLAFLSMEIQGSFYHHLYVLYRHRVGGDTTATPRETPTPYPYESPTLVRALFTVYRIFYGWQDAFVRWVVQRLKIQPTGRRFRSFLTQISVFGLGFHLLILAIFSWFHAPHLALILFFTVFNVYLGALLWSAAGRR